MAKITLVAGMQRHIAEAENPHVLLAAEGDSLAIGNPNRSNYDGLFLQHRGSRYKILSNIAPPASTDAVECPGGSVLRTFADGSWQRISIARGGMRMHGQGEFLLTLDCKRIFDESEHGRFYAITARPRARASDPALIGITYRKHSGGSPDSSVQYSLHLCIATTMGADALGEWRCTAYEYDARRGTHSTPWVYDALRLHGIGELALAIGDDERSAQQAALDLLLRRRERDVPAQLPARALLSLQANGGIMAGLPWFFQSWSRDELISCGGLLALGKLDDVTAILERWYAAVSPEGVLPAIYPDQGLPSSDAPGWLGRRTLDLILALERQGKSLPRSTLLRWQERCSLLLDRLPVRDGLVWNDANTTWMDTSCDDGGRAGARVEIQALALALQDAHAKLCALTGCRPRHLPLDPGRLIHGGTIIDGLHPDGAPDLAVRPNLFLAWYAAPRLFAQEAWRAAFAAALPHLWLEWGGLASISRSDARFRPAYTGEDTASYHRGDSWYFLNNIAAMALHSVDPALFGEQVRAIMAASWRDLTSMGYVGYASEVSSAGMQEPCGCFAQAWSASTMLEALSAIGLPDEWQREGPVRA